MGQLIDLTTTQEQWGTGVLQGVTANASGDLVLSDTTGVPHPVLWFPRQGAYAEIGLIDFRTATLTFECRVRASFRPRFSRPLFCFGNWNEPVTVYLQPYSDQVSVVGNTLRLETPWGVADGVEAHLAVVFSIPSKNIKVYVNGVLKGTTTNIATSGLLATVSSLYLGGWGSNPLTAGTFLGTMRDIRIWTTARTQAEIQANMGAYLTGTETGLAAYYPCNVFTDNLLVDVTGNGHHARLYGGCYYGDASDSNPITYYTESFESSFGDWYVPDGALPWLRRTGASPSAYTGPSAAQDGTYYVYVETSVDHSNTLGDTNILQYDPPAGKHVLGLNFYVCKNGADMGVLHVEGLINGEWLLLTTHSGDSGTTWHVSEAVGSFESVRFRYVAAGGFLGDIGLDNVMVATGTPCLSYSQFRISPPIAISLSGIGASTCRIEWNATPHDEWVSVDYTYSLNGGLSWGDWVRVGNGEPLYRLQYKDLSNAAIRIRQSLLTTTAGVTPEFHDLTLTVDTYTQTDFLLMNPHAESQKAPWSMSRPHRLAGRTLQDGQPVRRRVEVRYRRTHNYVVSTCTQDDGVFHFDRLPVQTLANPYVVLCYDDHKDEPTNALIFDRVYSVDDDGLPPQT